MNSDNTLLPLKEDSLEIKIGNETVKGWTGRSIQQISADMVACMDELKAYKLDNHLKPYWSSVVLESEAEIKRLETVQQYVRRYLNYPCGEIYFIVYVQRPEGRTAKWFSPTSRTIVEVYPEIKGFFEYVSINDTPEITFEFKYDPEVYEKLEALSEANKE